MLPFVAVGFSSSKFVCIQQNLINLMGVKLGPHPKPLRCQPEAVQVMVQHHANTYQIPVFWGREITTLGKIQEAPKPNLVEPEGS